MPKLDLQALQQGLCEDLQRSLATVVVGAASDVALYAGAIARDMVAAASSPDLRRELLGQLQALAELNRLRVAAEQQRLLTAIVDVGVSVLTRAMAAIPAA